ncbi:MAG: hypothetical protein Q8886_02925, partial [Candidatus Phytoplasma australasiaticum]|nr:hypothetical protein [Candidatus Phytoplasma australasiaticum]
GGHLTHGSVLSFSGIFFRSFGYNVSPKTEIIEILVDVLMLNRYPSPLLAWTAMCLLTCYLELYLHNCIFIVFHSTFVYVLPCKQI